MAGISEVTNWVHKIIGAPISFVNPHLMQEIPKPYFENLFDMKNHHEVLLSF